MSQTAGFDPSKISEMFEFLREPSLPSEAHATIVFGRKDTLIAKALADLASNGLVTKAIITGGIGKDSGDLRSLGYGSEAEWLKERAVNEYGADPQQILVETQATNGAQNARNALGMMGLYGIDRNPLTVVSHATSLRRLAETVRHEAVTAGEPIDLIYRVPSSYEFNPYLEIDAQEAFDEYARLVKWPTRSEGAWLQPQLGLDPNLVDYVHEVSRS